MSATVHPISEFLVAILEHRDQILAGANYSFVGRFKIQQLLGRFDPATRDDVSVVHDHQQRVDCAGVGHFRSASLLMMVQKLADDASPQFVLC
jgi:hypothetical protein